MTSYSNIEVSGVQMRAKLGGPEKGGESGPIGDIQRAHFVWLTKEQRKALPRNVGIGSKVTVRFPSIGKSVKGELKRYAGGSGLVDLDEQLDLTRRQAKVVLAKQQSSAVRK